MAVEVHAAGEICIEFAVERVAELAQLRFLCFAVVVGELGGEAESDAFCSCAQAAFLLTAVDGRFACDTVPDVVGADSNRLEGQPRARASRLQQISVQGESPRLVWRLLCV